MRHNLQALGSLTVLRSQSLLHPVSCKLLTSITQLAYAIEHRLLRARPPSYLGITTDASLLLYESCRLVLLICISYIFRSLRAASPALQVLSGRLLRKVRTLTTLNQASLDAAERDMLVWMLIVGGIASSDQTEYVAILSETIRDTQAVNELALDAFVWSPLMHNNAYITLFGNLCDRAERVQIALV